MKLRAFLLLFFLATPSFAQTVASPSTSPEPGSELRIFLMTLGPGDAVWERFGHNAIVVEDTRSTFGVSYNWGMFDFEQPGYVPRLMKGRMIYWMAGYDAQAFANAYINQNRSIWMQELNLTPEQRIAMRDFLEWNSLEANKFYRYDYYRDNCSTRVRDAINRILNGQLEPILKSIKTDETYRSHTERLTFDDPLTYTGLQLAMGNPIDEPLTAWEESFIPMELMKWVRQTRIRDANGQAIPLVAREVTMFEAQREPLPEEAPNLIIWYLLVGVLLGGVILFLGRGAWTGARKVALAVIVGLWCFVTGFFGLIISLLWAFTDHSVTYYNENVMQANPLLLILAVLATATILGRMWAPKTTARIALLVAGLSALGFMLQIFPRIDQVNGEIIALMMPVHIAIAYILNSPRRTVTA